jgi:hypothetical protein
MEIFAKKMQQMQNVQDSAESGGVERVKASGLALFAGATVDVHSVSGSYKSEKVLEEHRQWDECVLFYTVESIRTRSRCVL